MGAALKLEPISSALVSIYFSRQAPESSLLSRRRRVLSVQKILVRTVVVIFVVTVGRQNKAYRARRKIVDLTPDHPGNVDAVIATVEMKGPALAAVINVEIERTRHGDDQLLQLLVGMTAAFCAAGNVVKIIDALNVEGDVIVTFDKGQIPPRIIDTWKVNDSAVAHAHG